MSASTRPAPAVPPSRPKADKLAVVALWIAGVSLLTGLEELEGASAILLG